MKVIKPSYEILYYNKETMPFLEKIARVCYKSEDKIEEGSCDKLIDQLITRGHEAMIEHSSITVKFISNRGFSHELVRHRIASFAQESTRYCDYSKDKHGAEITVIEPYWYTKYSNKLIPPNIQKAYDIWYAGILRDEEDYFKLRDLELPPQGARGKLPIDLKTEIVMTANIREWRSVFKLRCAAAAHPDMRNLMLPLLYDMHELFPILFGDIYELSI